MPNRRSAWTVRRLILAVGVVAILLGVRPLLATKSAILAVAQEYAFRADIAVTVARDFPGHPTMTGHDNVLHRSWGIRPANLAFYVRMRDKYEHAASCPWMSVEPDPPEPE